MTGRSILALAIALLSALPTPTWAAPRPKPVPRPTPIAIAAYARVLRVFNPELPAWQSESLARHVLNDAARWKVDANLLVALVSVESSWHTHAVSWSGAVGLGQLMPGTAARLGVDPYDPYQNLFGTARYLGGLLQRFARQADPYALAVAAYNTGPLAVAEVGGIPWQAQGYVARVFERWERVERSIRIPPAPRRPPLPKLDPLTNAQLSYWTGR
jgi:soluble lytic murein transglycosylase-like protein